MTVVEPSTPQGVVNAIITLIAAAPGRLRVAIDGAQAAEPVLLAEQLVRELAPRPALLIRADHFWRQASLRLEDGRHDVDAWLERWVDEGALRREVLDPLATTGRVLPALRDPITDRSLRTTRVELPVNGVVVLAGALLLGRNLEFDIAIHLYLSGSALARRTPADQAWTLPGLERYERRCHPQEVAQLVVRADDPRRPALVHPSEPHRT